MRDSQDPEGRGGMAASGPGVRGGGPRVGSRERSLLDGPASGGKSQLSKAVSESPGPVRLSKKMETSVDHLRDLSKDPESIV